MSIPNQKEQKRRRSTDNTVASKKVKLTGQVSAVRKRQLVPLRSALENLCAPKTPETVSKTPKTPETVLSLLGLTHYNQMVELRAANSRVATKIYEEHMRIMKPFEEEHKRIVEVYEEEHKRKVEAYGRKQAVLSARHEQKRGKLEDAQKIQLEKLVEKGNRFFFFLSCFGNRINKLNNKPKQQTTIKQQAMKMFIFPVLTNFFLIECLGEKIVLLQKMLRMRLTVVGLVVGTRSYSPNVGNVPK